MLRPATPIQTPTAAKHPRQKTTSPLRPRRSVVARPGSGEACRDSLDPLLEAERAASSPLRGALEAAFSRLPWSLISVDRFVRMRRAFRAEHAAATPEAGSLCALVVNDRDRVDRELEQLADRRADSVADGLDDASLRGALRRPAVITWLVILTPSVMWFVIGGWPQTAGLQTFMTQPAPWKVLFPITVLAQAWLCRRGRNRQRAGPARCAPRPCRRRGARRVGRRVERCARYPSARDSSDSST